MKQRLTIIILATAGCAVFAMQTSCGGNTVDPELAVSTHTVKFGSGAGYQTLNIKANMEWNISGAEATDWLTVSPSSGDGTGTSPVKVAVTANLLPRSRSANLVVKAGTRTETVEVTQEYASMLEPEKTRIENVPSEGATIEVKLKTSGEPEVAIGHKWIEAAGTGSPSGEYNTVLKFDIAPATAPMTREGTITFRVGSIEKSVTIVQPGPGLTIPTEDTGMYDDALAMADKMGTGWNLGNTMEPPEGEGRWNNPAVTRSLIKAVADAGFKNIRIPCAWNSHTIDAETHQIDPAWLDRVAEVVGWCLDEGLYVMLNIHWDGGWLEEHPYHADRESVNKKQKALWEQIAVRMRDFDQRLIFAGTNEVHHGYTAPSPENVEVQLSFNQTFVDAVRSTGGRNACRNLAVQAYNTNIDYAVQYMQMPDDSVDGRLFVEVHYYDPYEFSIAPDDEAGLVWGNRPEAPVTGNDARKPSWGDEDFADGQFDKMKTNFVDRGIPVIVGEYGVTFRTGLGSDQADHDASNVYYLEYVTRGMVGNGLVPIYWDNGATSGGSGLFNRNTCDVVHKDALDAIIE